LKALRCRLRLLSCRLLVRVVTVLWSARQSQRQQSIEPRGMTPCQPLQRPPPFLSLQAPHLPPCQTLRPPPCLPPQAPHLPPCQTLQAPRPPPCLPLLLPLPPPLLQSLPHLLCPLFVRFIYLFIY
jgi:hypothetical protein